MRKLLAVLLSAALASAAFGFPHGGAASSSGQTFAFYLSPTGSGSTCSLSSPCDISSLTYTPDTESASYFQAKFAGQRVGLLPGCYPIASYWNQQAAQGSGYSTALTIPSGSFGAVTYVGSSNSSGYYSARTATIDAHPGATTSSCATDTETASTWGSYGTVTAITTGNPTIVTVSNVGANVFAVGQSVWFYDNGSGSEFTSIGLTVPTNSAAASTYPITAASCSSGSCTVTITATTSGTWTAGVSPSMIANYPAFFGACIGQNRSGNAAGVTTSGYWTLDGVNLTGCTGEGAVFDASVTPWDAQANLITAATTGTTTVFTIASTAASNPYSVGDSVYFGNLPAPLTAFNYNSASPNRYTVATVGGSSGEWTFTIDTMTSGTFTAASDSYVNGGAPGVRIVNSDFFDMVGQQANNNAALYSESALGLYVGNNKFHDVMLSGANTGTIGEGSPQSGATATFYEDSPLYEYNTIYNVTAGIYSKAYPYTNITIRYNFIQVLPTYPTTYAIEEGQGQNIPGFTYAIYNNILIATAAIYGTSSDSQAQFTGSLQFYNNTWYWPYDSENVIFGPYFIGGGTASGEGSFSPAPQGQFYNNIFNAQAGGSGINSSSYIGGSATGTSSAPTNLNIALSNYNGFDGSSSQEKFNLAAYSNDASPNYGGIGSYTLAEWQSDAGLDAASAIGTPTYSSSDLGYQYPTSNFALTSSSFGHLMGHVGGVSSGASIDIGAWGGTDVNTNEPIAQIGSNF